MSGALSSVCCCSTDPSCFFGVSANDGATACEHTTKEELIYKRDRPAFNSGYTRYTYTENEFGNTCSCAGTYVTATACQASPTIVVRYKHFQNNDPTRIFTWYYRNFSDVFPQCDEVCCGYGTDDGDCCDGNDDGDCSQTHRRPTGALASKHQANIIDHGWSQAQDNDTDSSKDQCEYGDDYKWLQGVSDRSSSEFYRHWGVSGSTVTELTKRHLCATIIAVFHREHWYERYENSLDATDSEGGSDIDRAASACATPLFWAFACAGNWVSTWEIKTLSSLDSVIGSGTADDFLIRVNAGDPIPEAWLDVLEDDGIIGPVKDWGQAGGELIKKTLSHYNDRGQGPSTETAYFFGRPGGYTYVCADFTSGNEQDVLDNYWPQIVRRSSVTCDIGGDSNCHTAAPVPGNDCTCATTTYADPASIGCNPCVIDGMGDCVLPVESTCGDGDYSCHGDVVVGTCRGVWVQYWEYLLKKATETYTLNYVCSGEVNNGYLCRINPGETCDWDELPDDIRHDIPSTVSGSMRSGTSDTSNLCCGGEGTHNYNSFKCPSDAPNSAACPDPTVWGPGL